MLFINLMLVFIDTAWCLLPSGPTSERPSGLLQVHRF